MRYLLLNSIKGLKKKKIQMLGIIFMVFLSTGIYTTMSLSLDRLENKYYDYLEDQNVEYFAVEVALDYTENITIDDLNYLEDNQLKNITSEEAIIINSYRLYLENNTITSEAIISEVSNIFMKYEANIYINSKVLDEVQETVDFEYEYQYSKVVKIGDIYTGVIPYIESQTINKIYLLDGVLPANDGEITILPEFAKIYDIAIGDNYEIGENSYLVVGYAYASNYIYPLISFSSPIFDKKTNNVVYANEVTYNEIAGSESSVYSITFGNTTRKFQDIFTDEAFAPLFENENIFIGNNAGSRLIRISALQLEFASDRLFANYFLYLLLGIAVFIIGIITKKRIDDERLQIGVLKSLGYKRTKIAFSYLVYPVVGSLIGGILGYIAGIILHFPLCNLYLNYFLVPLDNFKIDPKYIFICIVIPMIFLSILSYLVSFVMLRKKPLDLLREGSNLKVNIFTKLVNKITSKLPFKYKFKYSLAFRSIPKLIIVSLTSFFTGLLIVLTLIGMNLFDTVIEKSFDSSNYNYSVSMNNIFTNEFDETSEYVMSISATIIKIEDENNKEKDLEKSFDLLLQGIDQDTELLNIEKDSLDKLIKNQVVVSTNMKDIYKLEINDYIYFNMYGVEYELQIEGFYEDYTQPAILINRTYLSNLLGFEKSAYNVILSNNDMYVNFEGIDEEIKDNIAIVISIKDLKDNITTQMQNYNASIYIVIAFAAFMALIIISVIANIVVEENKKTISLMKVLGYENKKISAIVLNIYTPIIIISYLLSVPAMVAILKKIISAVSGDIGISIPITMSYSKVFIGLIALLLSYYIAIYLSKKVLNKIPLAIALKRE